MSVVAKFNTRTDHNGARLASVLREYPDATVRVAGGWIEFHSDAPPILAAVNDDLGTFLDALDAVLHTEPGYSEPLTMERLRDLLRMTRHELTD